MGGWGGASCPRPLLLGGDLAQLVIITFAVTWEILTYFFEEITASKTEDDKL